MVVNDDAGHLTPRGACASIASKFAPTEVASGDVQDHQVVDHRRPLLAHHMGVEFQGQLGATGRQIDLFHPSPRMDARAGRYWRREAQAVGAVIDHVVEADDLELERDAQPRLQHLHQRTVGDGAAEGALPASFSNECLEDLLAFKAKLLRKAEVVRNAAMAGDDDEVGGEAAALTLNFIDIEPGGRGFSRPVTVRAPQ